MNQVLSYILFVFDKIVSLLSVKPFPDMPITIFQFIATILVLKYLFRFIFGGTRELELFANTSIRDYTRKISNNNRKKQLIDNQNINNSKLGPNWLYDEPVVPKMSEKDRAEMEGLLSEFR